MPNEILHKVFSWLQEPSCRGSVKLDKINVKSLNGFSRTCRRLREICTPTLFHTVSIRGITIDALARIEALLQFTSFESHVKKLEFIIDPVELGAVPIPRPSTKLSSSWSILLKRLPLLQDLVLSLPHDQARFFAARAIALPHVHTLTISEACGFATHMCPNVTSLNGYKLRLPRNPVPPLPSILEGAPVIPGLTVLTLSQTWTENMLELAVSVFPNLRKLGRVNWTGWPPDVKSLSNLISQLARFEYLESLTLADVSQLPEGFHFRGIRGNAKGDPGVAAFLANVAAQRTADQKRLAAKIIPPCLALKELWIGYVKASVTRHPYTSEKDWVWSRKEALLS